METQQKNFGLSNLEISLIYQILEKGISSWRKGREKQRNLIKGIEILLETAEEKLSEHEDEILTKIKENMAKTPKMVIVTDSILDKLRSAYTSIAEVDEEMIKEVEDMIEAKI